MKVPRWSGLRLLIRRRTVGGKFTALAEVIVNGTVLLDKGELTDAQGEATRLWWPCLP